MLYRLDPVFFLLTGLVIFLSRVVVLVLRRRWSLAEARREEVMRLVQLASEEATRAEMETVLAGGSGCSAGTSDAKPREGGGEKRCAVCYSPTTTRCSKCKSVLYCSGKCQIVHWRQGHKEECCPYVGCDNGQLRVSDLNRLQTERPKLSQNSLGIEGKPFTKPVEALIERSASSESNYSSEVFSEEDNIQDTPFVSTSGTESSSDSSTCYTFSGCIETVEDASTSEITSTTAPEQSASAFFFGASPVKSGEFLCGDGSVLPRAGGEVSTCKSEEVEVPLGLSLPGSENCTSSHLSNACYDKLVGIHASHSTKFDNVSDKTFQGGDYLRVGIGPPFQMSPMSGQVKPSISMPRNEVSSREKASLTEAILLGSMDTTVFGIEKPNRVPNGRNNHARTLKSKESTCLSSATHVDHQLLSGGGYGISPKVDSSLSVPTRSSQSKNYVLNGNKDWKVSVRRAIEQIKAPKTSRQYPSRACSLTPEKHGHKMVSPYEIFIKLYNLDVEVRPFGLVNCGNSCYANVVLQCLAITCPLTAYFLDGFHTKACPKKDWCFTCELESLLAKAKQGNSPLSPIRIISHIKKLGRNLDRGREEDAHEFLRYAIDAMQSACIKESGANVVGRMDGEPTLFELIFGGYLQSKIRCMRCQVKSEQQERMMDLNVEIHDVRTLGEALTHFTTTEILDGKNKYYCNRCKSYERAKKKLTILEAPNVLTITLKRYQSGKFGKLNKAIRFPECMNLAPYMTGTEDKSPVYRLYGVVVHLDTMNAAFSGHYVCYVKSSQGMWYEIDDSVVSHYFVSI